MFLRRVLGPTVVLLALTLLHPPQCAHAEVIFEDYTTLTGLNKSIATYDAASRELHIKGNKPFNITLAGYAPTLSMDLKLGDKSEIQIVSAESLDKTTCMWKITTEKSSSLGDATCTMTFGVDDDLPVTFKTKDNNNTDFARLQVDVHPNPENIASDLPLASWQEGPKGDVLKGLKKCDQLRPTQYPKQWIQPGKPPPSSDVTTYMWHLAVQKTLGNNFIIHLPDGMTPVRLEPDPTTTAAPTTAAAFARSTTPGTTSTTQSGAEGASGALSGLEIGLICVCSILVFIGVIGVSVHYCLKRARKEKPSKDIEAPNQDPSETETAVSMHVVFDENLYKVYDGEPEVGEYVDRPNPKKKKKKKIGNRRRDHAIIEGRPKADHAIIEGVAKKKGNKKADCVIIDKDDKPPSRN